MGIEIWKDIVWYEWKYQVSNMGNVRSLNYKKLNIIKNLKQKNINWYMCFWLYKNSKKHYLAHRLVALSFISNPNNKKEVNHKNWIKNDNRVENLEWCTHSENIQHSFKVLWHKSPTFWKFWKDNPNSRKINQYTLDWEFIKTWYSINDAERQLNISHSEISKCCRWIILKTGWYKWEYFNINKK